MHSPRSGPNTWGDALASARSSHGGRARARNAAVGLKQRLQVSGLDVRNGHGVPGVPLESIPRDRGARQRVRPRQQHEQIDIAALAGRLR